jgi:hypothetical protein
MVEEDKQNSMIAPVLGAIGGVLLLVGAFLTWVTVSVDLAKLGQAFHIDLSSVSVPTVFHAAGTKGWEGKLAVVAGVIAIVGVVMGLKALKRSAPLLLVGGAIGTFAAIYAASFEKTSAINDVNAEFAASGFPGKVSDYLSITLGIGLWICLIAGILCIVAGVIAFKANTPASVATASPPMTTGSGFGAPAPAPTPPPATPMTTPPPVPPADPTSGMS